MDLKQTALQILREEIDITEALLVEVLTGARDEYYNSDDEEPSLTDEEFDSIERILQNLNPNADYFETVGSDVRGGKEPLPFVMGSLDQNYAGDTERWIKANGWDNEDMLLSDKLDGTSGAILYDTRGVLQKAFSRGNGTMGADITRHIRNIKNTPQRISRMLKTRVEVMIPFQVFRDKQASTTPLLKSDGKPYKNPRNYVAGRMNASEGDDWFYENARVRVTSIVEPKMGKLEQLEVARTEGFEVADYSVVKGRDLNDDMMAEYLAGRRADSPWEMDGLVIDLGNADLRAKLRQVSGSKMNPSYSRKFKPADSASVLQATVVGVNWNASKAGYMKPQVEFDPIDHNTGITITFATGFNAKFITDNNIGPGAVVELIRAGDVIPYIRSVITPAVASLPDPAVVGSYHWTDGNVDIVLDDPTNNKQANLAKLVDIFKHWDVPFLREGTIEKLIAAGFDDAVKIIKATEADLKSAIGDSAGSKVFEGLKSKLNPITLPSLAGGSQTVGRGIGTRKLVKLYEALGSFDDLTVTKIAAVDGFEAKTASIIVNNWPQFEQFLADIAGYYTLVQPKAKVVGGDLDGVVVVFTGVRRSDLEEKIVERGGRIGSGVNKDTTYLVTKDPNSNSGKMKKARDLGLDDDHIIGVERAEELWA